jgi:hypothetical protein
MSLDCGIITGDINNDMPRVAVNNRGYGQSNQEIDMTSIPRKPGDEKTHIYALVDPKDKSIRYIGKSDKPKYRFLQHMADKTSNRQKAAWITSLQNRGLKPKLKILETVPCELWGEAENYWIHFGKARGWPLTNIGPHGGGKFTDDEIDEIMYNYLVSDTDWNRFCGFPLWKKQQIIMLVCLDMFELSYLMIKARGGNAKLEFNPNVEYRRGRRTAVELTLADDDNYAVIADRLSKEADERQTALDSFMRMTYPDLYGHE